MDLKTAQLKLLDDKLQQKPSTSGVKRKMLDDVEKVLPTISPELRREIESICKFRDMKRERMQVWKRKDGKTFPIPSFYCTFNDMTKNLWKKRIHLTDSDLEEDWDEKMTLNVQYDKISEGYTDEELDQYEKIFKEQDLFEKNRELRLTQFLNDQKKLKTDSLDPFSSKYGTYVMKHTPQNDGIKVHKRRGMYSKTRPKPTEYFLSSTDEMLDDVIHLDANSHNDVIGLVSSLWDEITPIWRLYTFHFTDEKIQTSYPKFMVGFEEMTKRRMISTETFPDIHEDTEERIFTNRVKSFNISKEWKCQLNHTSDTVFERIEGGSGLEKFLTTVSRMKGEKWTPHYQSATIVIETVPEIPDHPEMETRMKLYVLVGRENIGRDIDSSAYILVATNHFDASIPVEHDKLNHQEMVLWMTRIGTKDPKRNYCGSTDMRITECVEKIRSITSECDILN